jgi:hypothetical protein
MERSDCLLGNVSRLGFGIEFLEFNVQAAESPFALTIEEETVAGSKFNDEVCDLRDEAARPTVPKNGHQKKLKIKRFILPEKLCGRHVEGPHVAVCAAHIFDDLPAQWPDIIRSDIPPLEPHKPSIEVAAANASD